MVSSQSEMLLHLLFTRSAYNTTCKMNMHLKVTYPKEKEQTRKKHLPHIPFCNHVKGDQLHNNPQSYSFTCSARRYVVGGLLWIMQGDVVSILQHSRQVIDMCTVLFN